MFRKSIYLICFIIIGLTGCRGQPSDKPPIHWNPNMDTQQKYKAQRESKFFQDKRSMRYPVEGTVARGQLKEDDAFYRGMQEDGTFVSTNPMTVDDSLLKRGGERFNIYCSPCHDKLGSGKGIVVTGITTPYGLVKPPSFHEDRIRELPDGHFFNVITNGARTMLSYKYQIPDEKDRWAIVAYIRALQNSQKSPSTP